ncbi:MAG TPA: UDP-2,4-diacetamido-2,4,6-trideoxy-beta-L-altropyranose hydrolase [Verrucomicrobiae bacterium]
MNLPTLIIRADASAHMGTGHVMRCLALAEPWLAAGSQVILAAQLMPEALGQRALQAGVRAYGVRGQAGGIEDAWETVDLAERDPDSWLVVDGYQFGEGYFGVLKQAGVKVLQIDDFGGLTHYETDFVLNQNLGAAEDWYPQREKATRLLLGTRYVQLRGEFLKQNKSVGANTNDSKRILVTLGGSDPDNVTAKVIAALQTVAGVEATVVVGGSNPHWEDLQKSAQGGDGRIRLVRNASNMPELMAQTDLAIAAGGTTAWEFAYMGVPMMTIVLADNQRSNGEQLEAAGVSLNLGWHEDLTAKGLAERIVALIGNDAEVRDGGTPHPGPLPSDGRGGNNPWLAEMSAKARKLVDGLGSMRVWLRLNEEAIRLRAATGSDAKLIFDWANDAGVRAVSFASEPIAWENHLTWFEGKLSDANYRIWVAEDSTGAAIGQVRFQIEGGTATISISLDAAQRGKNRGSLLIWTACKKLFAETDVKEVLAYIKPDNQASVRAFEKVEFQPKEEATVKGLRALVYSVTREGMGD